MRHVGLAFVALFGIAIGLYPALYFLVDMSGGLLGSKPDAIRESTLWNIAFYQHIVFGGLALLTGWPQFIRSIRTRHLALHRAFGKVYIVTCILSGVAAGYLAIFATGGIIASLGFGGLAAGWLLSTSRAFLAVRSGRIEEHRAWMIRSYALAFAAVTLRLWLPLMTGLIGLQFATAYLIVSWMCWVPNLIFAEFLIRNIRARGIPAV